MQINESTHQPFQNLTILPSNQPINASTFWKSNILVNDIFKKFLFSALKFQFAIVTGQFIKVL